MIFLLLLLKRASNTPLFYRGKKKKVAKVIPGSKTSSYSVHLGADKNICCDFLCHSISNSLIHVLIKSGSEEAASILK